MNRNQNSEKKKRVPVSAIHLAYQSDSDLRLIAKSTKRMSIDVTTSLIDDNLSSGNETKILGNDTDPETCDSSGSCNCRNCHALQNLTKCGVCFESLQNSQIKSCALCCNVVCVCCASRLTKCPFCRSILPLKRNQALERLVNQLALPCKNSRFGCKILLDGESRFIHESICNFFAISCPLNRGVCEWQGTVANVQSHLHQVHNLQPLKECGISVEIRSFRVKAQAGNRPVFTICLACYDQLFVIRMVLFQSRLRLSFTRLGHETSQPNTIRLPRYGVLVSIEAHSGRQLRSLVPFDKYDREIREITVTYDNLYPTQEQPPQCPHRRDNATNSCKDDLVEIDLLIKELKEQ